MIDPNTKASTISTVMHNEKGIKRMSDAGNKMRMSGEEAAEKINEFNKAVNEQEEAEEELEVSYKGDDIEIGFNVNYLLDALGAIESDEVTLSIVDGNSSCLVREPGKDDCKYVVMPMRL